MYIKLTDTAAFWFSQDLELLHAAEGILRGADKNIYKIFGDLSFYRRKYRLAAEIGASFADDFHGASVCECLQGFDVENFTLTAFREYVLSRENLPADLLGHPANDANEAAETGIFSNYLGAAAFFSHTHNYVNEIFTLAEALRTPAFFSVLKKYEKSITAAFENVKAEIAENAFEPLLYSDRLINKRMYHRGPYDFHVFATSVFLRFRYSRYFKNPDGGTQFLFCSLSNAAFDDADLLRQLKALGDDTRFKIMAMIKERGHLQGNEIARDLKLTAATVSHHMRVLREAGLLHEEPCGNARIYSVPTNTVELLSEGLNKFFKEC
ncbi:hypothetical protein FACS189490_00220 [Clostridia bacterium]|nr:hypothetical protein FACS189490_00220 [Clostridia bacterium]